MTARETLHQWFVPAEGIDRDVISANIQKYLGPDATVRPGSSNEGVRGFWIKAYRTLTNPMITDLKSDTLRWRQEQSRTGTRESYVGSSAHHAATTGVPRPSGRGDNSPATDERYNRENPPRERMPASDRMSAPDHMDIDQPDRRYGLADRPDRVAYHPDGREYRAQEGRSAYPADGRQVYYPEGRPPYQGEQPVVTTSPYDRAPVAPVYGSAPGYPPNTQQSHDAPPAGYMRQGNYYVPVSTYEPAVIPPRGFEQPQYAQGYVQPPQIPSGRDPRDARDPRYRDPRDPRDPRDSGDPRDPREMRDPRELRDPREVRDPRDLRDPREARDPRELRDSRDTRYGGVPDYSEPRYAYPSPATTVASIPVRDREPAVSSAPKFATSGAHGQAHANSRSAYSTSTRQYDQYGQPVQAPPGQLDRSVPAARDPRGAVVRDPREALALARDPREAPAARDPRDPPVRDPREVAQARERERLAAAASTNGDTHRNVRRRER